jgi:hypothetical protein
MRNPKYFKSMELGCNVIYIYGEENEGEEVQDLRKNTFWLTVYVLLMLMRNF